MRMSRERFGRYAMTSHLFDLSPLVCVNRNLNHVDVPYQSPKGRNS